MLKQGMAIRYLTGRCGSSIPTTRNPFEAILGCAKVSRIERYDATTGNAVTS